MERFRVDSSEKGFGAQERKQEVVSIVKIMAENLPSVSSPLKLIIKNWQYELFQLSLICEFLPYKTRLFSNTPYVKSECLDPTGHLCCLVLHWNVFIQKLGFCKSLHSEQKRLN